MNARAYSFLMVNTVLMSALHELSQLINIILIDHDYMPIKNVVVDPAGIDEDVWF